MHFETARFSFFFCPRVKTTTGTQKTNGSQNACNRNEFDICLSLDKGGTAVWSGTPSTVFRRGRFGNTHHLETDCNAKEASRGGGKKSCRKVRAHTHAFRDYSSTFTRRNEYKIGCAVSPRKSSLSHLGFKPPSPAQMSSYTYVEARLLRPGTPCQYSDTRAAP